MQPRKITLQYLADQLGVSKVTVFKALNNQPGVSRELHKKIHALATSTGYLQTYLQNGSTAANFAFITPKRFFAEQEMFYTNIYFLINNRCIADAKQLALFVVERADEDAGLLPRTLEKSGFDGIFVGGEMNEDFLRNLEKLGIPIVVIDSFTNRIHCDMILTDNYISSYLLTQYLIGKGHRKIGFVGRTTDTHNIADRYFGYRKALLFAGLEYKDEWNVVTNDPVNFLYSLDFALPKDLPTAFVCHCDNAAHFMIQKLTLMGFSVPEDVSLVAFDNTDLAKIIRPSLTTIENNREAFANRAYETMLKRQTRKEAHPYRVLLTTTIIERESVKTL
jgi:LacI family transcriptional regulator